jgi:hypothetical protein
MVILLVGGDQCGIPDQLLWVHRGQWGVQYRALHRLATTTASLSGRTGCSVWHFVLVTAHPVCHLFPLLTAIQVHSLLVRTGLLTGLSVPVVDGPVHNITPLLLLVSLSFPASYWLPDHHFLLPTGCQTLPLLILHAYIYIPYPQPFMLPWRQRQQDCPKHWYPTATLHIITTQKTSTWIFTAVKTSNDTSVRVQFLNFNICHLCSLICTQFNNSVTS